MANIFFLKAIIVYILKTVNSDCNLGRFEYHVHTHITTQIICADQTDVHMVKDLRRE